MPPPWRQALIDAGYPVTDGVLYTDGFPLPFWNLTLHIASMDSMGVNYSTISVSAPGVSFPADNEFEASALAREVNDLMYNYMLQYPTRLGAMCLLPLPNVEAAVAELKVFPFLFS